MIQLGQKVKDKITGFTGVITGVCDYLSGCNQALVVPPVKADGSYTDGHWFDVQRLDVVDAARLVLDNGATPGCDIPAPIR